MGWQDAVAGLQTQINTINSQISVLSGQQGTQASEISSLQSQVSTLQTQVLSIQNQLSPIADLSGQMSTLHDTFGLGVYSIVQLSGGGDAILSIPSSIIMDGKLFQIRVDAKAHVASSLTNVNFAVFQGQLFDPNNSVSVGGGVVIPGGFTGSVTDASSTVIITSFWDASLNKLGSSQTSYNGSGSVISGSPALSVSSQSDLQFRIGVVFGGNTTANPSDYITINGFSLKLV